MHTLFLVEDDKDLQVSVQGSGVLEVHLNSGTMHNCILYLKLIILVYYKYIDIK